jgi:predicted N-acetyltransferase YhbS
LDENVQTLKLTVRNHYGEDVQGLVVFDAVFRRSRINESSHALSIQYLATAPWNRMAGVRSGRFRGVGSELVREAIRESIRQGLPGRVRVNSFVNASSFFEALRFENVDGEVWQPNRTYLELRPSTAFKLLATE